MIPDDEIATGKADAGRRFSEWASHGNVPAPAPLIAFLDRLLVERELLVAEHKAATHCDHMLDEMINECPEWARARRAVEDFR